MSVQRHRRVPPSMVEEQKSTSGTLRDFSPLSTHTYNPNAIERHFVVVPLQVVIPPFVCQVTGEVGICGQAGPHLEEDAHGFQSELAVVPVWQWWDTADKFKMNCRYFCYV